MKKLYLFLVALMVSIAMNAAPSALYLIGTLTGANWSENKTNYPFESKGNGVFVYDKVLDGTNGDQWFRLYDGTQEYAPEEDGYEVKMDSSWPLKQTDSGAFKIASKVTKLTVVFDENGKGTIYGGDAPTGPVTPPDNSDKYAIHGTIFNGEWVNGNAKALSETTAGSGIWELTTTIQAGEFGIRVYTSSITSQTAWIGSSSSITSSQKTINVTVDGSNINNQLAGEYKITFNKNEMTLTFEKVGDGPNPPTPGEDEEYTVYFYNNSNWPRVKIWAWAESGSNFTVGDWPGKEVITTTKKYKDPTDNKEYEVYSYTFTVPAADKSKTLKVLFNSAFDGYDKSFSKTDDLALKNNALYSATGAIIENPNFIEEEVVDPYDVTFYYYNKDKDDTTWDMPKAHVHSNTSYEDLDGTAVDLKYRDAAGNVFSVVKYVFHATRPLKVYNVCMLQGSNYKTNAALAEGALYTVDGLADANPQWYNESTDPNIVSIYFNLGADYLIDNDTDKEDGNNTSYWRDDADNLIHPYAVFRDKSGNWSMTKQMTPVEGEDCMFTTTFDATLYQSVKFSNLKSDNLLIEYPVDSESAKKWNDEIDDWYKYVLVADGENSEHWATQSWLTFEAYVALRDGARENYCVASNNLGWETTETTKPVKNGICFFPADGIGDGNKFKMSYITPWDVRTGMKGENYGNKQRWWATFNLGIIGPNPKDTHQDEGDVNKYANYDLRIPMSYNHYCKYDWKINTKGVAADKVYVVVDPKEKTLVLLTFDPLPSLKEVNLTNSNAADLNLDNVDVENVGKNINGWKYNGEARVKRYNDMTSSAKIYPSKMPDEFYTMYRVMYTIYLNGVPVSTYLRRDLEAMSADKKGTDANGNYYIIDIANLAPGASDVISFDATYTFIDESSEYADARGLKFHSKLETSKAEAPADYPTITLEDISANYATPSYFDKEKGQVVWDAIIKVPFQFSNDQKISESAGQPGFVCYPEIEVITDGGENGYIADANNRYFTFAAHRNAYDAWGDYKPHTKYDGVSDYNHDTHNWSIKARKARVFHIYLPGVARTSARSLTDYDKLTEFGVTVKASAAYPFMIDKVAETQTASVRAPKRAGEAEQVSGVKTIVFTRNPVERSYEVVGANVGTSGINDVDIDAIEGEGELYNLQGVRVYGEPTPGIYLRRQGNQVVKVAIR